MTIVVSVLADSLSNPGGVRFTTFLVTMPRIILAQLNKHASIRSSTQSNRAIPFKRLADKLERSHYVPSNWRADQRGMVPGDALPMPSQSTATKLWEGAFQGALNVARLLDTLGVHKQWVNRIVEPYAHAEHILSGTEWQNFWNLRCKPDAQDEMATLANRMREAYEGSRPFALGPGEYHLPFLRRVEDADVDPDLLPLVCSARCARVSYLNHNGQRNPADDVRLGQQLLHDGHLTPLEMVATPSEDPNLWWGPYRGWRSYRHELLHRSGRMAATLTMREVFDDTKSPRDLIANALREEYEKQEHMPIIPNAHDIKMIMPTESPIWKEHQAMLDRINQEIAKSVMSDMKAYLSKSHDGYTVKPYAIWDNEPPPQENRRAELVIGLGKIMPSLFIGMYQGVAGCARYSLEGHVPEWLLD